MFQHNKKQSEKTSKVMALVSVAKTEKEFLSIVKSLCFGRYKIAYNNKPIFIIDGLVMLLALGSFILGQDFFKTLSSDVIVFLAIIALSGGAVAVRIMAKRRESIERLNQFIILKSLYFKHGIKFDQRLPAHLSACADLKRGNHSRTVGVVGNGVYEGSLHKMPYYFCHLHYVDKESRGNRSEMVHYDRYYLFMQFPWVKGISVRSDSNKQIDSFVPSDTTSEEFNRTFTLTGFTKMHCALFAKPITVLQLLKFSKVLRNPNLMFMPEGWLCIGFNNKSIFTEGIKATLKTPDKFYYMIRRGIAMNKMTAVMELAHELAEQHDDNFEVFK